MPQATGRLPLGRLARADGRSSGRPCSTDSLNLRWARTAGQPRRESNGVVILEVGSRSGDHPNGQPSRSNRRRHGGAPACPALPAVVERQRLHRKKPWGSGRPRARRDPGFPSPWLRAHQPLDRVAHRRARFHGLPAATASAQRRFSSAPPGSGRHRGSARRSLRAQGASAQAAPDSCGLAPPNDPVTGRSLPLLIRGLHAF